MLKALRNNSKIVLAVVCVVLMLAWLVLPSIEQIFQARGSGGMADPVKVTWKGGRLKASELQRLRVVHYATDTFIRLVIQETMQRQGNPHGPGVNPQFGMLGITQRYDDAQQQEGALVETLILAQHARQLGVKVNDATVKDFLEQLGDYTLKEGDLAELIDRATPDSHQSVTAGMIFEHLKTEILAQQARIMLQAGIENIAPGDLTPIGNRPMRMFFGGAGALPPSEMWQAYERLNRRVQIEAYPLHVQDYVSKVTAEPKDAELRKLFEEGRTRIPNPASKEPGFMQPHKVAFQYVKAEIAPFLEAAKKEITDEQIAKAYEEGKAKGEFKVPEPPATPETKPADPNTPKDPTDKPFTDKPEDKPATDKPANDKPATNKPDEKPAGEKPAEKPAEPKDDGAAKKDDTKKNDAKPAEPKKNDGSALRRDDVQLVNFQEDDKKPETKPAEAKPAETKPAEEKPAEPAEAKPADNKPADNKPDNKPADNKPTENVPTDPATKPEEKPAEKEVKFKPLDEVKEEIRTNLARPIAAERRQELVTKIIAAVNAYSRQYNRWKAYADREKEIKAEGGKESRKVEKPEPLDLPKIVGDPSLKVEVIPLVDRFEVQETVEQPQPDGTTKKVPKYEIGVHGFRFFEQQSAPFANYAFSEGGTFYQAETLPFPWENKLFMGSIDSLWVFWRTDEQRAKELDFAAAREQVVEFWKEQEALKLAEADAKKLAEQAGKGKELKSLVAKPEEVITPPAFSWLSTGLSQFGLPSPSEIVGVEYAGNDFRQAVFDLQVGQAGIALDQPQRTVYVVRMLSEEGLSERDRERFMEKATDRELVDAAWQSQLPLQSELYNQLFEDYNVTWLPSKDDEET